ncbi:MAG: type II toxin-antitoxin system HicA family toxin [Lachnospiraceae bacterium]|nr:type II toxin-antitoxin system HicA family toxin [Lachnospiraceae bacterium]
MSQKDKLIRKLKSKNSSFTFDEAETLLNQLTYYKDNKGKTSGSRVMFISDNYSPKIFLHKPHPRKELLAYQKKQLFKTLKKEGLL